MSYANDQGQTAVATMEKNRNGVGGEVGAALMVVGLSSEQASREVRIRDDMIRVADRAGASVRQMGPIAPSA